MLRFLVDVHRRPLDVMQRTCQAPDQHIIDLVMGECGEEVLVKHKRGFYFADGDISGIHA